jgi:hypothetical protein
MLQDQLLMKTLKSYLSLEFGPLVPQRNALASVMDIV